MNLETGLGVPVNLARPRLGVNVPPDCADLAKITQEKAWQTPRQPYWWMELTAALP